MDVTIGGGQHDIMSDVGYSNTLFQCLNLRPGTGCWLAPVCSTWVFMTLCLRLCPNSFYFCPRVLRWDHCQFFFWPSIVTSYLGIQNLRSRGSTGRSIQRPLGWQEVPCVHQANVMIARVCILLMVLQAKRIWWCLEQPCNSLLEQHPMFQRFLTMAGVSVRRLSTKLLWFGGPTQKPTWIYSSPFDSQRVHILSYVRW